ncbi:MAG: cysteine--tRNA ligase [Rhodobacteraceae bacterium]|nr:cysteine--tRNA ligase [Paracoccaceae bacterium]
MTEIKLYNTKTNKKEVFTPLDAKDVRMYVCGPTVYDRAHIGNARPVIVFDVLYRLLRKVYDTDHVRYARNFTDVDDKINAAAAARKAAGATETLEELISQRTEETIAWYLADMGELGNLEPDHAPRATEFIQEMIDMSITLIAEGHAYEAEGHVLFDVTSYKNYGSLSGRSVDDMIAGARIEVAPYKRNPMDFVLWKPSDANQPGWQSPWGRGRPGWHIECSAMAEKLFGKRFDIHGGGLDLAFPHHENEKAQSCACGVEEDFAQVWMHNEMLQVEGKKMSKSLGNFFSVRALIDQGYSGEVIRLVFLGTHYRKPMDWTDKKAKEAEATLRKAARLFSSTPFPKSWLNTSDVEVPQEFVEALANDLNTSLALTFIRKYLKEGDKLKLASSLELLGFNLDSLITSFANLELSSPEDKYVKSNALLPYGEVMDSTLLELANRLRTSRQQAMQTKDFASVDALKLALTNAGVSVQMSKDNVVLEPTTRFDKSKLENLL